MFVAWVATIDATWRATAHVKFPPKRNDAEEETSEIRSGVSREYFGSFRLRCYAEWSFGGNDTLASVSVAQVRF